MPFFHFNFTQPIFGFFALSCTHYTIKFKICLCFFLILFKKIRPERTGLSGRITFKTSPFPLLHTDNGKQADEAPELCMFRFQAHEL